MARFERQMANGPHFISSKILELGIACFTSNHHSKEETVQTIHRLAPQCLDQMLAWSLPVVALAIERLLEAGLAKQAIRLASRAIRRSEKLGCRWYGAELDRLRGDCRSR